MEKVKLLDVLQVIVEEAIPQGIGVYRNDRKDALYMGPPMAGSRQGRPDPNIDIVASISITNGRIDLNPNWHHTLAGIRFLNFDVNDPHMPTKLTEAIKKITWTQR